MTARNRPVMDWLAESLGLSMAQLAVGLLIATLGAVVKGLAGFGASMIWAAGLALVLPPRAVVPLVLIFEVASSLHLLPRIWRQVDWRSLRLLLVATWLATPFGIMLLATLPADPLRLALAAAVLTAAVLIGRGFALRAVPGTAATLTVGASAGVLNGSMAIVGPPVILFYFSSPLGLRAGRASLVAFFLGTDTVGTAMLAAQGLITGETLARAALFLPLVLLGTALGNLGFTRASEAAFRRAVLGLLVALALALASQVVWSHRAFFF
ncbi:MAG: sulfite exporter TauE/SafE family protein [Kiloniellales bacterium]|nr:sulfite exporter TauE/SafE family protein [Kiloniellales bacterium]